MKSKTLSLAFLLLLFASAYAQSTFEKIIQTDPLAKGSARSVIKTKDGGFAVAGYSFLNDILSSHFMKFDASGKMQWQKTFKRASGGSLLNTCIQTKDKGFALLGIEQGIVGAGSSVIKLDSSGNILWYKKFGGEFAPGGVAMAETADSSLVIGGTTSYLSTHTGTSENTYCAFKLSSKGDLLWNKVFINSIQNLSDKCLNMLKTENDEFILSGYGIEHDNNNSAFIKFNTQGEVIWSKGIYGGTFYVKHFDAMLQNKDTLIAFGWGAWNPDTQEEFKGFQVIKMNNITGEIISAKRRNHDPYNQLAPSKACIKTKDGGYIVVGGTTTPWFLGGLYPIVKYDKNFEVVWAEKFYADNFYPEIHSIAELNNGSLVAVGELNDKIYVAKLTSDGGFCRQLEKNEAALSDFDFMDPNGNYPLTITENMYASDVIYTPSTEVKVYTKCTSVLPLQLLSFSANHGGKTNLLKWSTAQELNTDHFEIQRSSNSRDFASIGTVQSFNNGKAKNDYTFTDAQPLKSINYYRLKMIDKDGGFTYSTIKNINNVGSLDVSIYPNPVHQNLTLGFNTEKAMDMQIEIVNAEGKKVYSKKMQLPYGASLQTMNVAAFKAGNYFVKFITTDGQTGLKFVKR